MTMLAALRCRETGSMTKVVWLLTSIGMLATAQATPPAQGIAQAYERALYPNGIPPRLDWDDKPHVPTFALLDDATAAGGRAALVTERMPVGPPDDVFADAPHRIKVATFVGSPGPLKAVDVVDVTAFLTNWTDEPGHFRAAGGSVSPFKIDANRSGLHVNAYSMLSGNGAVTGAFDLFFEVRESNLTAVLLLSSTTTRWRANAGNLTVEDSAIFVVDTNGDGVQEIVVQRRHDAIKDDKRMSPVISPPDVYAFDGHGYRPSTAPRLALRNAKPIERAASAEVRIVAR
jgi:hypothetical protein